MFSPKCNTVQLVFSEVLSGVSHVLMKSAVLSKQSVNIYLLL